MNPMITAVNNKAFSVFCSNVIYCIVRPYNFSIMTLFNSHPEFLIIKVSDIYKARVAFLQIVSVSWLEGWLQRSSMRSSGSLVDEF